MFQKIYLQNPSIFQMAFLLSLHALVLYQCFLVMYESILEPSLANNNLSVQSEAQNF